jgi:hypothetical protein
LVSFPLLHPLPQAQHRRNLIFQTHVFDHVALLNSTAHTSRILGIANTCIWTHEYSFGCKNHTKYFGGPSLGPRRRIQMPWQVPADLIVPLLLGYI